MDEHNKTLYSSFGNFFAIFDWYLFLKVEALQNFIIYVSMKHIFQKKFRGLWVVWRKIFQQSCMYGKCHSAKNWRCGNFLNLSHSRRCRLLYFSRAILWLSQCRTAPPTTSHFRPILGSKSMAPWGEASQIGWSVNVPKIRTKWMVWYQLALAVSFCHLDP